MHKNAQNICFALNWNKRGDMFDMCTLHMYMYLLYIFFFRIEKAVLTLLDI